MVNVKEVIVYECGNCGVPCETRRGAEECCEEHFVVSLEGVQE